MRSSRVTASVITVIAAGLLSSSAMARHVTPLPSGHGWNANAKHFVAPPQNQSGTWSGLAHSFPGAMFPDTALVMTNGTVLMHDGCTVNWFRLTPDANGLVTVDTGVVPSWVHNVLAISCLLANARAVQLEIKALLESSRVVAEVNQLLQ